jgi:poly(3-hydroxyalkanoate) synthetase
MWRAICSPSWQGTTATAQCDAVRIGLGCRLDPREITCPAHLLAGADDGSTTPEQVLHAATYLGTPQDRIVKKTVAGGHVALFMGPHTLKEDWPQIARWIVAQSG